MLRYDPISSFSPVLGGVDVRGLLYGVEASLNDGSAGILTGVSYSKGGLENVSAFAIGSEWTPIERYTDIPKGEMIGYVSSFYTALGVLQGWKWQSMQGIRDARGVMIGSLLNAGFGALWVQQTYGIMK